MAYSEIFVPTHVVTGELKASKFYKVERPTCEKYEPNFEKVFKAAGNPYNIYSDGTIVNDSGDLVAQILENELVFGAKRWMNGVDSNANMGPLLVKNPTHLDQDIVGIRNGMFVFQDTAFAVRINNSGGLYITRPIIPEYQACFVEGFWNVINTVFNRENI